MPRAQAAEADAISRVWPVRAVLAPVPSSEYTHRKELSEAADRRPTRRPAAQEAARPRRPGDRPKGTIMLVGANTRPIPHQMLMELAGALSRRRRQRRGAGTIAPGKSH